MTKHEEAIKHYLDKAKYDFKYLQDAYRDKQNYPELFDSDMVYIGRGDECLDCCLNNTADGFTLCVLSDGMVFQLPNGNFKVFRSDKKEYSQFFYQSPEYAADRCVKIYDNIGILGRPLYTK